LEKIPYGIHEFESISKIASGVLKPNATIKAEYKSKIVYLFVLLPNSPYWNSLIWFCP